MLSIIVILPLFVVCLPWKCEYPEFGSISTTHFLVKNDNSNAKWVEKYEYCNKAMFNDANCVNSRNLCYMDEKVCVYRPKPNDLIEECRDIIKGTILPSFVEISTEIVKTILPTTTTKTTILPLVTHITSGYKTISNLFFYIILHVFL